MVRGGISKAIPRGGGVGQILHYQLVSTTLKTHHKKFQLNRSRNGGASKNSKNLWWVGGGGFHYSSTIHLLFTHYPLSTQKKENKIRMRKSPI